MEMDQTMIIKAEPYPFEFVPMRCALLIIDMQRDFLEPGGFGEMLGNDVSQLRRTIEPNRQLLAVWRAHGLQVLHTREGHRSDLTDLPPAKKVRGRSQTCIGDPGPMGRILVRGEPGHDIIPELYPLPTEPVIDKPGKGAFFATDLHAILQNRGIEQLIVTGVTTEECVNTTVRNAVYIGHPGWKAMGKRIGSSAATGVMVILFAWFGIISVMVALIPVAAISPILLYIGMLIGAQAFQETPKSHAPAGLPQPAA